MASFLSVAASINSIVRAKSNLNCRSFLIDI